jgi:hypothetical protein
MTRAPNRSAIWAATSNRASFDWPSAKPTITVLYVIASSKCRRNSSCKPVVGGETEANQETGDSSMMG